MAAVNSPKESPINASASTPSEHSLSPEPDPLSPGNRSLATCRVFASIAGLLSLAAMAGWIFRVPPAHEPLVPMAPGTALGLCLLSGVLLLRSWGSLRRGRLWVCRVGAVLTCLLGGLVLAASLGSSDWRADFLILHCTVDVPPMPIGATALSGSCLFLLAGGSLLVHLYRPDSKDTSRPVAAGLALGVLSVALMLLFGYADSKPVSFHIETMPGVLPTAAAFALIGAALLSLSVTPLKPLHKNLPVVAVLVLGTALSHYSFKHTLCLETERIQKRFERISANLVTSLKRGIENDLEVLWSLAGLFDAFGGVDRRGFGIYMERFWGKHSFYAVVWAPVVEEAAGSRYVEEVRRSGIPSFLITELDGDGAIVPARSRAEHFPILYFEGTEGRERALGFDLASIPAQNDCLRKARTTGRMTAVHGFGLLDETGKFSSLSVALPVYASPSSGHPFEDSSPPPTGFIVGFLRAQDLVQEAVRDLQRAGVEVSVFDITSGEKHLLHTTAENLSDSSAPLSRTFEIPFADRTWMIRTTLSREAMVVPGLWHYWWVPATGVLATVLLATYFFASSLHRSQLREILGELRETQVRFDQLTRTLKGCFWLKDAKTGNPIYISPGYETVFSRSRVLRYRNPRDTLEIVHPEDRSLVAEALDAQLRGEEVEVRYRILLDNGSIRWIWGRAFPVVNEKGVFHRIAGIQEDITRQKEMEQQVINAKKLEATTALMGGIAHDFNNLLGIILGNINLAQLDLPPDCAASRLLNQAVRAARKAGELTRTFITVFRGGDPQSSSVSVPDLLEESMAVVLRGGKVQCEASYPEDLWNIEADAGQIRQVLVNLILNAKEAMPHGGIVGVWAENLGKHDIPDHSRAFLHRPRYVKISIQDHGIGIPRQDLEKIFDPYFSTKDRYSDKGLGLGLTIVQSIVKRHGGHIDVESKEGIGTIFYLYLPAAEEPEKTGPPSGPEATGI